MTAPGDPLLGLVVDYRPTVQTLHVGLYVAATLAALLVGYWIYRTRRTRGGLLLAATFALLAVRTGSDALHALAGELWVLYRALLVANPLLELAVALAFVRFAGRYAGLERLTGRRATRATVAVLTLSGAAAVTNSLHGLVVTDFRAHLAPFVYATARRGPIGLALYGAAGLLLLSSAGLLAHAFAGGRDPARWPSAMLALAVFQAVLVGGLQLFVDVALTTFDYTAIALAGFVFTTALALFDHGLRRIEAIARGEVLDEMDDAVVFLDAAGRAVDANAAARRLFGPIDSGDAVAEWFTGSDALALDDEPSRFEVRLSPDDGPSDGPATNGGAPTSDGDAPPTEDDATPTDGTHPDAGDRHFLVHATPVTDETGRRIGHTLRFADVTELKRRTRELRRKNDQLDQFASTVSHDLRNPLQVASGYVEMAAEAAEGPGEVDVAATLSYLEKVDTSLDRMTDIIADIEALVDDDEPVTDVETVAFAPLARDAWAAVATGEATLRLEQNGRIAADPDRLQRLLENLFRNAVEHAGDDVTVRTGVTREGFHVADDGPGIPESDRDRIFEHGYTTGDEGTGLGLSIVQQLAEAHGWSVALDPDHDGARFVVTGCEVEPMAEPAS